MSLWDFVSKYQGKVWKDPNGEYNGECVSLVKDYLMEMGWPMLRGNAINWQYNGTGVYKWIKNYIWTVPQAGDIAVFQVGTDGHIGIVLSANARTMDVFSQNWPQGKDIDPANTARFDYVHPKCIGFLRHI